MRLIDRLYEYLANREISAYAFEHTCGIANGYLKKQYNGKGSIGSEILEKINRHYPDLNIYWLLTGQETMWAANAAQEVQEEEIKYRNGKDEMILLLQKHIALLEKSLADKDKLIEQLEARLQRSPT